MSKRSKDLSLVTTLMSPYLPIYGLSLKEWLNDDSNVCLVNDKDDLALFEQESDSLYVGHYFFKSRGKDAVTHAQQFLNFFVETYQPKVIKGLTPLENLGARWLSRKLGFKGYGVVQTPVGPCELFILTKKDWENKINE